MSNFRVGNASFLFDASGNIVGFFNNVDDEQFVATYASDASGKLIGVNGPNGLLPLGVPALTWANRPPASTQYSSFFATDVGGGNFFISNGTRFKPVNGSLLLDSIDTPNAGPTTTAITQVNSTHAAIPASVIAGFDRLRVYLGASKNGATDAATIRLHFGPLGTVADPVVALIALAAPDRSFGSIFEFKRASNTTLRKQGAGNDNASYGGAATNVYATAVTFGNMDTTTMFMSISTQMTTGGTDSVTIEDYTLELYSTDS